MKSALSPNQVEAIRRGLDLRHAILVSVLANAGLRQGEALALRRLSIVTARTAPVFVAFT